MKNSLTFKTADQVGEFEQIESLNYLTFVSEIPQHPQNREERLRDKFHSENTYFICLDGGSLTGMLAVRSERPFSLDGKLANLDELLPPHKSACEVRLLAVKPKYRNGNVFCGLAKMTHFYFLEKSHDLALISGTLRQAKLYAHLGFTPFGPQIGTPAAPYQAMFMGIDESPQLGKILAVLMRALINEPFSENGRAEA